VSRARRVAEARMLDAWERGAGASPARRALLLLALALPGAGQRALAALPVGRRDACLFALRRALFGERMACGAACPRCGERLEFTLEAGQVLAGVNAPPDDLALEVEEGAWTLRVRLPSTADLLALTAGGRPPAGAARALLLRCVLDARRGGREVESARVPARVLEAAEARMAEADAASQVRLSLACPACANAWDAAFDVAAFLWRELEAWALRVTADVHLLAARYGWSERQVLALGPRRRRRYLELARS